ncbi:hypothetical protein CEK29_13040 [Bordetella genomosp. 5]|uniref:N-acetyltransferase YedL n=1 Tax=Bordetella genomosp. 5 TaxID=1395608 RepID=A0A261TLZ0_9BORD|nr:hypothetical protein [Bordetella genomosp. 5]OZI42015.1 hypothetical protein CEK29_13040 [Bordetella genomosp. 5]OZI50277.1 hypothetical protein CAL25_13245 [Bordetella genomosp. 5]
MKQRLLTLCAIAALAAGSVAHAQAVQEYSFPNTQQGNLSPPSTLRITESGGTVAAPPPPIRDTPQSVREYERCRTVSDRAAVTNQQRQDGVAQCLKELQLRRQAGQ